MILALGQARRSGRENCHSKPRLTPCADARGLTQLANRSTVVRRTEHGSRGLRFFEIPFLPAQFPLEFAPACEVFLVIVMAARPGNRRGPRRVGATASGGAA